MSWEESWEQDKYEAGRVMHDGWKRQKIVNGFADHPWPEQWQDGLKHYTVCDKPFHLHHADMIDWDALPERLQAINYEGGREGYQMGYESGHEQGYEDGFSDGEDEGYSLGQDDCVCEEAAG